MDKTAIVLLSFAAGLLAHSIYVNKRWKNAVFSKAVDNIGNSLYYIGIPDEHGTPGTQNRPVIIVDPNGLADNTPRKVSYVKI